MEMYLETTDNRMHMHWTTLSLAAAAHACGARGHSLVTSRVKFSTVPGWLRPMYSFQSWKR